MDNFSRRSRRDIWRLEEKLIRASLDRLNKEMEKSESFKDLMLTPLRNLNEKYLSLYDPEFIESYKDETLFDIISESLDYKDGVFFFSEAGEDLEGFAFYQVSRNGTEVRNITLFSFDVEHPNLVLARDMIRLLKELKEKFLNIQFSCIESQPVIKAYQKITKELNGYYELDEGIWYFEISGNKQEELKKKYHIGEVK